MENTTINQNKTHNSYQAPVCITKFTQIANQKLRERIVIYCLRSLVYTRDDKINNLCLPLSALKISKRALFPVREIRTNRTK